MEKNPWVRWSMEDCPQGWSSQPSSHPLILWARPYPPKTVPFKLGGWVSLVLCWMFSTPPSRSTLCCGLCPGKCPVGTISAGALASWPPVVFFTWWGFGREDKQGQSIEAPGPSLWYQQVWAPGRQPSLQGMLFQGCGSLSSLTPWALGV